MSGRVGARMSSGRKALPRVGLMGQAGCLVVEEDLLAHIRTRDRALEVGSDAGVRLTAASRGTGASCGEGGGDSTRGVGGKARPRAHIARVVRMASRGTGIAVAVSAAVGVIPGALSARVGREGDLWVQRAEYSVSRMASCACCSLCK